MLAQDGIPNQLLAAMALADFDHLATRAVVIELVRGVDLSFPDRPLGHCWFPLSGLISVVAHDENGGDAEVGLVGNEGAADLGTLLGDDTATLRLLVQVSGKAVRIDAAFLQQAMVERPALARLLLAYACAFTVQITSSALAFARYPVPQRLARWLLMAADRVGGHDIGLTHDSLALMLGVRRAGVTVALNSLSDLGLISGGRRRIAICDRPGLLRFAAGGYGVPEAEYRRLLGRWTNDASALSNRASR